MKHLDGTICNCYPVDENDLGPIWDCDNCDGRFCMDCIFRIIHDECLHDCPSCAPQESVKENRFHVLYKEVQIYKYIYQVEVVGVYSSYDKAESNKQKLSNGNVNLFIISLTLDQPTDPNLCNHDFPVQKKMHDDLCSNCGIVLRSY